MNRKGAEPTLEFLLEFHGRIHHYAGGYWLKFEITKVQRSESRPHGLRYSFTLHGPDNERLIGFDNSHPIAVKGTGGGKRAVATDHWHRSPKDGARPYEFRDAETLLGDFFDEVERVLQERGVPFEVLESTQGTRR